MNKGFTLIEVVVALSVLLIGGVAALGLMARTNHIMHLARNQFVALNVAREGLELVRAIRDSNWLTGRDWSSTLCIDNSPSRTFTIDNALVRNSSQQLGDATKTTLYIQGNNEWTHQSSPQLSGFSRLITIDCSAGHVAQQENIMITSTVTWQEQAGQHSVDVKEQLFNWYKR